MPTATPEISPEQQSVKPAYSGSPSPSKKTEICSHIRIYEDGPERWIVWDDYEEECPIFPTWESALEHANEAAELRAMEAEYQANG